MGPPLPSSGLFYFPQSKGEFSSPHLHRFQMCFEWGFSGKLFVFCGWRGFAWVKWILCVLAGFLHAFMIQFPSFFSPHKQEIHSFPPCDRHDSHVVFLLLCSNLRAFSLAFLIWFVRGYWRCIELFFSNQFWHRKNEKCINFCWSNAGSLRPPFALINITHRKEGWKRFATPTQIWHGVWAGSRWLWLGLGGLGLNGLRFAQDVWVVFVAICAQCWICVQFFFWRFTCWIVICAILMPFGRDPCCFGAICATLFHAFDNYRATLLRCLVKFACGHLCCFEGFCARSSLGFYGLGFGVEAWGLRVQGIMFI